MSEEGSPFVRNVIGVMAVVMLALGTPFAVTRAAEESTRADPGSATPDSVGAVVPVVRDSTNVVRGPVRDGVGRLVPVAHAFGDSVELDVPGTFEPKGTGWRPFLVPHPSWKPDSLPGLSAFDAFLLPPRGPSAILDRTDLRLTGQQELWEIARGLPGAFALEPGYLGTTTPISFHARGPDGTLISHGGRAMYGGLVPVENPNSIGKGPLTGLAVTRASASHLYGPGAGGGALLLLPLSQATERPYSEVTWSTGIFGQRTATVTGAVRAHRFGVVFNYDSEHADPWSLFAGFKSERYYGGIDFAYPGTRIAVTGRLDTESLKGTAPLSKRGDDTSEIQATLEQRLGQSWLGALRFVHQSTQIQAFGEAGSNKHRLRRNGGEVLLSGYITRRWRIGALAGASYDDYLRVGGDGVSDTLKEPAGFLLLRTTASFGRWELDVAARYDRLTPGQEVVAPGATLSRTIGAGSDIWFQVARTSGRSAYFHRITDFLNQVNQGVDLPRPGGQEIPMGEAAAGGVHYRVGRVYGEVAVVADTHERQFVFTPTPPGTPLNVDEPTSFQTETVESVGGWVSIDLDIPISAIRGGLLVGGSGFVGSTPKVVGYQMEPWRYGEAHGRLRFDVFGGALRLEGELRLVVLDEMVTPLGPVDPQWQVTGRASARIGDAVLFYRSENVFNNREYLSSAWDPEVGYAPITGRNVLFGLSWVLLD